MKYFNKNILCTSLLLVVLASCTKDVPAGMGTEPDKAKINFINAAPDAKPAIEGRLLAFYFKYNQLDYYTQPVQFPWASQYLAIMPGEIQVDLDTARALNATIPGPRATQLSYRVNAEADAYYSLFVTNTAQNPDTLFLKDDVSMPSPGKIKVRFINLSASAGVINIVDVAGNKALASGLIYKSASDFIEMDPADYSNVRIQDHTTGAYISPANLRVLLEQNNVYTIWAAGIRNPAPGVTSTLRLCYHANRYSF